MENNIKLKTLKGVIWSFIDLILNQGITLTIQIILARMLMPEDFGLIGIVIAFIAIAQTFVDSGFTNALIRETKTTQEEYSTVFYYNFFISILIYAIVFYISPNISSFYEDPRLILVLRVLSLSLIFSSIGTIQRTLLIKRLDFRNQTRITAIASFIAGTIAVLMAYFGGGIWSLVIYTLVRNFLQSLFFVLVNRWYPSFCFSWSAFKKYFNFGWKLLLSNLIDTAYANINSLIIGKMYSKIQLGYYTNAYKISNVSQSSIYGVVGKVSYPVLGKIQSESETLKLGFRKIVIFTSFVNFPTMIGLITIAEPLFTILFGSKWNQAIPYFQILCISGIIFPLQAINLNILQVKGRTDLLLRLTIAKKMISLIFIITIVIFDLSIFVLLWVGVFDSFISYLINSFYSSRLLNYSMKSQINDIASILLASSLMGITVWIFINTFNSTHLIELFLSVSLGVLTYAFLCKVFKVRALEDSINLLKSLKNK